MEGVIFFFWAWCAANALPGVHHALKHVESQRPPNQCYIQSATSRWVKNSDGKEHFFQAAVTMLASRARLAHEVTCLFADTTYKSTKGDVKQFRIVGMDPELAERKLFTGFPVHLLIDAQVVNWPLFMLKGRARKRTSMCSKHFSKPFTSTPERTFPVLSGIRLPISTVGQLMEISPNCRVWGGQCKPR
jgi:hypothetical protein